MPCSNVIARLLLKDKKARVIHTCLFTIRLKYNIEKKLIERQELTLGLDTGSGVIGSAVVSPSNGKVLYRSDYPQK